MKSRYYRQCRYYESAKIHSLTKEVMQTLHDSGHIDYYGGVSKDDAANCMTAKSSAVFGAFEDNDLLGYALFWVADEEITHRYAYEFGIPEAEESRIAVLNGMAVKPELWNQHIGTNLLRSVLIWADIIGVKYLVGIVHPEHDASLKLLSKCEDVAFSEIFHHRISRGEIPRRRFCITL